MAASFNPAEGPRPTEPITKGTETGDNPGADMGDVEGFMSKTALEALGIKPSDRPEVKDPDAPHHQGITSIYE